MQCEDGCPQIHNQMNKLALANRMSVSVQFQLCLYQCVTLSRRSQVILVRKSTRMHPPAFIGNVHHQRRRFRVAEIVITTSSNYYLKHNAL